MTTSDEIGDSSFDITEAMFDIAVFLSEFSSLKTTMVNRLSFQCVRKSLETPPSARHPSEWAGSDAICTHDA